MKKQFKLVLIFIAIVLTAGLFSACNLPQEEERDPLYWENLKYSNSVIEEALKPYSKYDGNFAGVFIGKDGRLNILTVDGIAGDVEGVIYGQAQFSYKYLWDLMDSLIPFMSTYNISRMGLDESENHVEITVRNEASVSAVENFLLLEGFDLDAVYFTVGYVELVPN